jgi:hypothetical protein
MEIIGDACWLEDEEWLIGRKNGTKQDSPRLYPLIPI